MKLLLPSVLTLSIFLSSCGGGSEKSKATESSEKPAAKTEAPTSNTGIVDLDNKGIGPISSISLGDIDQVKVDEGKKLFDSYCVACHKAEEDFIGPAPKGILKRRSPEWVMNMILNPSEMTAKDPIAKKLLEDANGVPMIGQGLTEEQTRSVLEYFRTL